MSPSSYNFVLEFVAYNCENSVDGDRSSPGHSDGTATGRWEVEAEARKGKGKQRLSILTVTHDMPVGIFKGVICMIDHPCAPLPLPDANEN